MGKDSNIEWCDHTFNPWIGCQKVGPGCDNCYAEEWDHRFAAGVRAIRWGAHAERTKTSAQNWRQPIKWNREAQIQHDAWECFKRAYPGLTDDELIARGFHKPTRPRVFCASLADVFDNAVPVEWRIDLFKLIADTPYLDWLILTKRIGNVMKMCSGDGLMFDMIAQRVWLGITVVNQEEADRDIPQLLQVPAAVRFLSIEPLLGPVDLRKSKAVRSVCATCASGQSRSCYDDNTVGPFVDWVIVGGESGAKARPMNPDWVRSLRDQCSAAGVPFLFKQWGEWVSADCIDFATQSRIWNDRDFIEMERKGLIRIYPAKPPGPPHFACNHWLKAGKKFAGRLLDGSQHDGYPEELP